MSALAPIPRCCVAVRVATLDDLQFIDGLQKQHSKQLGYFPTKQFEEYINMGGVLIAEADGQRVGYVISRDRYLKRDELGIIFQLCVSPGAQRKLIGVALIKAVFDRSAYGCRLYCCWCAQDIEANRFWESLGFVPVAFRAGSAGKRRVHIFWQRRIREGDTTTPYWFPSQTTSGAIRADRLVFPIPPGTHWSDAKPILLPGDQAPRQIANRKSKVANPAAPTLDKFDIMSGGLRPAPKKEPPAKAKRETRERVPRPKAKHDPRHIAAARELRDRYLEHINTQPLLAAGKYDVSRQLASRETFAGTKLPPAPIKQLPNAA